MDLRHLRYDVVAARNGSFSAAGHELNVASRSSVSVSVSLRTSLACSCSTARYLEHG